MEPGRAHPDGKHNTQPKPAKDSTAAPERRDRGGDKRHEKHSDKPEHHRRNDRHGHSSRTRDGESRDDRRRSQRRWHPEERGDRHRGQDSHVQAEKTRHHEHKGWLPESFVVEAKEGFTRFHDLALPGEIMHAIADLGFMYCTPIQAQVLPHALAGKNMAGQSQTGTGKTAAFLLAILTRLAGNAAARAAEHRMPRALILAPTRELVIQIAKDAQDLGRYVDMRYSAVYGGMDFGKQERDIESGIDVLAATPGRLLDFTGRKKLRLDRVEILVIDEADRMLDMGFIPDIKRIIRQVPPKEQRQTMLFSATLSKEVMSLAAQWVSDPVVVKVEPEKVAVDTVEQVVYVVSSRDKFNLLCNLLKQREMDRVLVFANRRDEVEYVAKHLNRMGVRCGVLSGAVDQRKRIEVLESFRSGKTRVVIATDVAARGLHIEAISHVINYDLPYEAEDYVHRIGRTARAGAAGVAISLACEEESFVLPEIEAFIGHTLPCKQPDESMLAHNR